MTTITASNTHHPYTSMDLDERGGSSPYMANTYEDARGRNESLYEQSSNAPLPNPPFVFPARAADVSPPQTSKSVRRRPESSQSFLNDSWNGDMGGRTSSPIRGGLASLPSFSFNPSKSDDLAGIPPQSPSSLSQGRPIPMRPGGHRRGGSEFIGGDGKTGAGKLLSTSPTKVDTSLPVPQAAAGNIPAPGRRGHAHRRSAAISCHDLSMIIKPDVQAAAPLSGSAPNTPMETPGERVISSAWEANFSKDASQPEVSEMARTERPARTTRVGFSEKIEFIPRPLSLVSSDASSTITLRPGHAMSDSLSSVISLTPATLPKSSNLSRAHEESTDDRPSTAGAVLGSGHSSYFSAGLPTRRRNSDPTVDETSSGVERPATPKKAAGKRSSIFGRDMGYTASSPNTDHKLPEYNGEPTSAPLKSSPGLPSDETAVVAPEGLLPLTRKVSGQRKGNKKQKKVKNWAGSILSRKAKPRSSKNKQPLRRSPTPPVAFSEDTNHPSVLLETSPPMSLVTNNSSTESENANTSTFANWKPKHFAASDDDDTMSPIIDLDAALGPFNTPSSHDSEWEAAQKSFGPAKRRLHSAARMRNFVGPGMHYHRRAESAPEMVPFDKPRFGLHHVGSNSTMEDVFEEDEEDDEWEEVKTISRKTSTLNARDENAGLGIEIKVVDSEAGNAPTMDWTIDNDTSHRGVKRKTSVVSAFSEPESVPMAPSMGSLRSTSPRRETFNVGDYEPPPKFEDADSMTSLHSTGSHSSAISLTPPLRPTSARELSTTEAQPAISQPPYLTPTTPNSTFHSPFPSPQSPVSYETQRLSTAPSSVITDPDFGTLWLGGPGPEIRMSVDDVPSLTSSNSTMTRESMLNPAFGNPQFRGGQRSSSLSHPSMASKKRSSIASLSRLLSSHGEKSKLSIEERAPETREERKEGKGKRMSRFMQFFKPSRQESPPDL